MFWKKFQGARGQTKTARRGSLNLAETEPVTTQGRCWPVATVDLPDQDKSGAAKSLAEAEHKPSRCTSSNQRSQLDVFRGDQSAILFPG